MALFGKKKTAETTPQTNPQEDIQMVGDADAIHFDETDSEDNGPTIDFDAIAQDLNTREDDADMDSFLGKTGAQNADETFATAPDFSTSHGANNIDDELDFDANFDDGSPAPLATGAPIVTDENPFGSLPDIEPINENEAAALTSDAPPLTHTAPLLTSDMTAGGAPAVRRSAPLLPLLGAAGLLVALGVVGYLVFGGASRPETAAPVVASSPPLQAPATGIVPSTGVAPATGALVPGDAAMGNAATSLGATGRAVTGALSAPGAPSGAVNPGLAVDGVPIAPGAVVVTGTASTVPPALQRQLEALWKQGAAAKRARNFAGARAAWTKILQLRPNHPGIQEAIDKLPAA